MQTSEFDKFADEYLAAHEQNLGVTGEGPEYFARYKIDALARLYRRQGYPSPRSILDFGCGIGASIPHLAAAFPDASIVGLDLSERSLAIANSRFPGLADYRLHQAGDMSGLGRFDLIFSSCVFHHIEAGEHVPILRGLKTCLTDHGHLAIFEHNPVNPVTRYIVATCPFDENAVLIPAATLADRQRQAGLRRVQTAYIGFFPAALRALRPLEPWLSAAPIGAQYYTFAQA
ncbi:MAG TPA: class I SAM-dependent methyltransferase [Phenylobacterium sp.]